MCNASLFTNVISFSTDAQSYIYQCLMHKPDHIAMMEMLLYGAILFLN